MQTDLLGPIERFVDLLDAAQIGARLRAFVAEDIPWHGDAHGIEAASRDAGEVLFGDESLAVLAHDLVVIMAIQGRDELDLVKRARACEKLRGHP